MTIWRPDTCGCVVDVEGQRLYKKCRIHNSFNDTLTHNQNYNLKHGRNPTENQVRDISQDKLNEKNRIKLLGDVIDVNPLPTPPARISTMKATPEATKSSFLDRLKWLIKGS